MNTIRTSMLRGLWLVMMGAAMALVPMLFSTATASADSLN